MIFSKLSSQASPRVRVLLMYLDYAIYLKISTQNLIDNYTLFIAMESENVKKLVYKVNAGLTSVTKVISGSLLLSPAIQVLGTQLLRGEVFVKVIIFVTNNKFFFNNLQINRSHLSGMKHGRVQVILSLGYANL
jgi:hypothetical protein